LQTKLDKRFSKGLSLLASYTWSKTINNSQGMRLYASLNRGEADYDRAHVVSIGHNWQLPIGPNQPFLSDIAGAARQLLAGWEFSGITQFQSGLPFSPTLNNTASLNADAGLRPDIVPGVDPIEVPGGQSRDLWFNPAAYRVPALYTFGNAGRNSLRGPGLASADLALHKVFSLAEKKTLTFRWEMYNAFNRTNLNLPTTGVDAGAGNAGRITNIFIPMRQMQFGLRFEF